MTIIMLLSHSNVLIHTSPLTSTTDCDGCYNMNRRHWGPQQFLLSLKYCDRPCDKPDRKPYQPFLPHSCHPGSCGCSDSGADHCYCGDPCYYCTEEEEGEAQEAQAGSVLEVEPTRLSSQIESIMVFNLFRAHSVHLHHKTFSFTSWEIGNA